MPSVSDLTTRAIGLLAPVPDANASGDSHLSDSVESLVNALTAAARSGDHEAIELLGNLAIASPVRQGQPESPEEKARVATAKLATEALLTIYSAPETHEGVRASIREISLHAFEIGDLSAGRRKDQKGSPPVSSGAATFKLPEPPVHLPMPLLTLALNQAIDLKQGSNVNKVSSQIKLCLGHAFDSKDQSLQYRNRFSEANEISSVLRDKDLPNLAHADQPIALNEASALPRLLNLAQQVQSDSKLRSVLINTGRHWVAAVIGPSSTPNKAVDVLIYDSLHEAADDSSEELKQKIQEAFGDGELGQILHAGGNVQRDTNGCGPLCARALRDLNAALEERLNPSIDGVAKFFSADTEKLRNYTESQIEGVVVGLRAQMLSGLEEVAQEMNGVASANDVSPVARPASDREGDSAVWPDGGTGPSGNKDNQPVVFHTSARKP